MIHVRFRDIPSPTPQLPSVEVSPTPANIELDGEPGFGHGNTADGGLACCRRVSEGLVDCVACLDDESADFLTSLTQKEKELALPILTGTRQAGWKGLTKDQLAVRPLL